MLGGAFNDMEREAALCTPGVMVAGAPAKLDAVGAEVDTIWAWGIRSADGKLGGDGCGGGTPGGSGGNPAGGGGNPTGGGGIPGMGGTAAAGGKGCGGIPGGRPGIAPGGGGGGGGGGKSAGGCVRQSSSSGKLL